MSVRTIVQRFAVSDTPPDLTGSGVVEYHWIKLGSAYLTRIDAARLVMLELDASPDLKANHGFIMLSGLSTPIGKVKQRLKDLALAEGIVPQVGDTLFDVLRVWRNKYHASSPNPFGFDISDAS